MRRIKLQFPSAADVWNFLVVTKSSNVEVNGNELTGFFTQGEMEMAHDHFSATVKRHEIAFEPPQSIQEDGSDFYPL